MKMHTSSAFHITPATELSEIVVNHPEAMLFLEHFDIKMPLQSFTVGKICEEYDYNADLFIALADLYTGQSYSDRFKLQTSDIPAIIRYLKNNHRYYLNEIYPNIQQCIRIISDRNDFNGINLVDKFFGDYFHEVREHLDYENEVAFPYIMELYDELNVKKGEYSVTEYKEHHNDIEIKLDDMMNLLIRYLPHKNDQQVRRKLFLHLVELDYDLKIHTLIEDLILIPLVGKLERKRNDHND